MRDQRELTEEALEMLKELDPWSEEAENIGPKKYYLMEINKKVDSVEISWVEPFQGIVIPGEAERVHYYLCVSEVNFKIGHHSDICIYEHDPFQIPGIDTRKWDTLLQEKCEQYGIEWESGGFFLHSWV